jgi:hypothetical protein
MVVFIKNDGGFERSEEVKFEKRVNADGKEVKPEEGLRDLLFENPELIPVDDFDFSSNCIPLVRELSIDNHGRIDIFATDNVGNIFIIECKLVSNPDGKKIRGQLTDYIAGIWAAVTMWGEYNEEKFEKFWVKLCKDIETLEKNKLEEILKDPKNGVDSVDDVIENMKQNLKENNIIGIFAIDAITDGLRETVDWNNKDFDKKKKYPMFILEVKEYSDSSKKEFISTQHYPLDLRITGSENTGNRTKNDYKSWLSSLQNHRLKEEKQILDFVEKLNRMIEKNNGWWEYGTGVENPRALPKFSDFPRRSPIGILANGVCKFQFGLMRGIPDYEFLAKKFEEQIRLLPEYKTKRTEKDSEIRSLPEEWLPHADKILESLEIFTNID